MNKYIDCKDCQEQNDCERTYLGGCTDGKEFEEIDMEEKKLTDENYKKILDGVMEQAEKDFGMGIVDGMFDETVIDTLKEMAVKHSNDSYVYRVLVNAIKLIYRQKAEIERLTGEVKSIKGMTAEQVEESEKLKKSIAEAVNSFVRLETLYKIKCKELELANKKLEELKGGKID